MVVVTDATQADAYLRAAGRRCRATSPRPSSDCIAAARPASPRWPTWSTWPSTRSTASWRHRPARWPSRRRSAGTARTSGGPGSPRCSSGTSCPRSRPIGPHSCPARCPPPARTPRRGSCTCPDGLERYRRLVRVHTTTDRTPEDLHADGRGDGGAHPRGVRRPGVRALRRRPTSRRSSPGSSPIRPCAGPRRRRSSTPRRRPCAGRRPCPSTGSAACPTAVCTLEAIPELEAEGAAPAYYMPPALDGSRPGTYYTNVNKPTERTSFDLESVAFHEAVPGSSLPALAGPRAARPAGPPSPHAVQRVRGGLGPVLGAARGRDGPVLVAAAANGHALGRRLAGRTPRRRHGAARLRLDPPARDRLHAREHAGRADRRRVGGRPLHRAAGAGAGVHDRPAGDRAPAGIGERGTRR